MHRTIPPGRLATACLLLLLLSAPNSWAAPAAPGLGRDAIEKRLQQHLKKLADAESLKLTIDARDDLIADYRFYRGKQRGVIFGQVFARLAKPALADLNDKVKQINLAIAAKVVREPTAVSLFYDMATHESTAVRFLGFQALNRVWPAVLNQGNQATRDLMQVAAGQFQKERSVLVLTEIARLLALDRPATTAVPAGPLGLARQQAFDAYKTRFEEILTKIRLGQTQYAEIGMVFSEKAYFSLFQQAQANPRQATALTQMLLDLMMQAALAYRDGEKDGMAAKVNLLLLGKGEDALIRTLKIGQNRINADLRNPGQTLALDLIQDVLDWVDDVQTRLPNVQQPKDRKPAEDGD
jgi:hypothetical protein